MALTDDNIRNLDEACRRARGKRQTSRQVATVTFSTNELGVVTVELTGQDKRRFSDWQAACADRAVNRELVCTTPVFAASEISFKPKA